MSNLKEVETAVRGLSSEDLAEFRAWFTEYDAEAWDRQIAEDDRAGQLEHLMDEALREHRATPSVNAAPSPSPM